MKKTLTMVLAFALVFALGVGGTLAWLTDTTDEVKNTFSPSDINITLEESENLDLQMVPGHTITKDPVVTVEANSEKCYVFIKVTENLGAWSDHTLQASPLSYSIDAAWLPVSGVSGVYYQIVDESTTDWSDEILVDNKVTVNEAVTKAMMDELETAGTTAYPTLTFKAAAIQYYKTNGTEFSVADAYAQISW